VLERGGDDSVVESLLAGDHGEEAPQVADAADSTPLLSSSGLLCCERVAR
jgi:hypothetical protein